MFSFLPFCGKARATHGDKNGLRQLLLHSEKAKSINYSRTMKKQITENPKVARNKSKKRIIIVLPTEKTGRQRNKTSNSLLIHNFPVHPRLEPVILRKPF